MSREKNGGQIHSMRIDGSSIEMEEEFKKMCTNLTKSIFYSGRNQEQIEVRKCLLSFGAESFFLQFVF